MLILSGHCEMVCASPLFVFVCVCVVMRDGVTGYDVACRFGCKAVSKLAKLILEKYPHIDAEYKLELQQLAVPACHLKSHTQSCQDQYTTDRFEGKGNLGNRMELQYKFTL